MPVVLLYAGGSGEGKHKKVPRALCARDLSVVCLPPSFFRLPSSLLQLHRLGVAFLPILAHVLPLAVLLLTLLPHHGAKALELVFAQNLAQSLLIIREEQEPFP